MATSNIVWFDIPVSDIDRAITFYSTLLGVAVHKESFPGGGAIGVLPHQDTMIGGCLVPQKEPIIAGGPLLYFNAQGRLDGAVAAAETNGGTVIKAKHAIGPHGFRTIMYDSEGNRIALHSME
jgi:predicted enzyme related to lactoylglutathione lyase